MDELAKRFADLAAQYGPQVADAAKEAARVEAYSTLAGSAGWFLAAGFVLWAGRFLWRKGGENPGDGDVIRIVAACVFFLGAFFVLPGIWSWIDPWTWTTIHHPELWLAKKAFHI